jgi:iron complex outermembrane receptor protein
MRLYTLGILCLLLSCSFSSGANPPSDHFLYGKITDSSGAPVSGAVIAIPDLRTGAVSDTAGNYKIDDLPKGRFLVQVHMLSYATLTRSVDINGPTDVDMVLQESIIEKSEVVITGTSLATEQRRSPSPIQIIRLKELHEDASSNIIDALAKLPGVSQLSTGPAISKPVIRGLGYNRIITISDGIRQEGQQWGDEHGIEIDDYNVSSVELLKGPASLAYGPDALAGVINIISTEPVPAGKILGGITTGYQTNNGMALLHAHLGGNDKGFSWNGYFTGKAAHDYKNKYDGAVYNTRFNNANYGFGVGLNRSWGYSRLSFTSFNQRLGIAEGERDSATGRFLKPVNNGGMAEEQIVSDEDGSDYSVDLPGQQIRHQKIALANQFNLSNGGRIGLTLGNQHNSRKEFEDILNPDEPALYLTLQTYTYDARYLLPLVDGWQGAVGVNGMLQHNENLGSEFLVPEYDLWDGGAWLTVKKDWAKWSVSGGIRGDLRQLKADALFVDSTGEQVPEPEQGGFARFNSFRRSFTNLSGSLGASYSISKRSALKLNLSTGFRAPNIAELSANGQHEGSIRYEYGNTGLTPERSFQADAGFEWNSDHVLLQASVFVNYIDNYIFIRKLSSASGNDSIPVVNNDDGFPAFIYGQQDAFLYGGELFLDLHPHPLDWLHLDQTFSYTRGQFTTGTDSTLNLPLMPPARWMIGVRAQKKSIGKFIREAYVKAGLDINFNQEKVFTAYETETATPAYTLVNAGLGFDIAGRRKQTICTIGISANNLLDNAYQSHLSRLKYGPVNNVTGRSGLYGMGRNFSINLSFPLSLR